MKLNKTKKVTLGILSFWPLAYLIFFTLFTLSMIFTESSGTSADSPSLLALKIIVPLHYLTFFVIIGLMVSFIVFIFKSNRMAKNQKVFWVLALVFFNMLAIPLFWYLYLWREPQPGVAPHIPNSIWYLLLCFLATIAIYAFFFIEIEFMGTTQKTAVVLLAILLFAYIYKYKARVKAGPQS